jgi:hypothetical protein
MPDFLQSLAPYPLIVGFVVALFTVCGIGIFFSILLENWLAELFEQRRNLPPIGKPSLPVWVRMKASELRPQ